MPKYRLRSDIDRLFGCVTTDSPEEAEARFKRFVSRILRFSKGWAPTTKTSCATRLGKNDFEVESCE